MAPTRPGSSPRSSSGWRKGRSRATWASDTRRTAKPGKSRSSRSIRAVRGTSSPVKIVVTGASGFIGSALVPALLTEGHEVVKLVRRQPEAPDEVRWDPPSGTLDPAELAGVEAAVHLAGANVGRRWTKAYKQKILDSRRQGTRLLAETLAALDPRPRVLI